MTRRPRRTSAPRHFGLARARVVEADGVRAVFLRNGPVYLELLATDADALFTTAKDGPANPGTARHLAFQVDDVDAFLAAAGGELEPLLGLLTFDEFIPGWKDGVGVRPGRHRAGGQPGLHRSDHRRTGHVRLTGECTTMRPVPDQTILLTGATDGMGRELARELAAQGASLILHGRNAAKGAELLAELRASTGNDRLSYELADFSSLEDIRKLADRILATHDRLDALVNNAGIGVELVRHESQDGLELTFQVDYLAACTCSAGAGWRRCWCARPRPASSTSAPRARRRSTSAM
ncbi:SDR family NAD(P)-dependent oxidoreductase [Streptomyces sp. L7]